MVQKVAVGREFKAGLRHLMVRKLCQPSSKWVPFSIQGRKCQLKESGFLSFAVPGYSETLTLTAPTAIMLQDLCKLRFYLTCNGP